MDDNPLFGLVEIIKVDFTLTTLGRRRALAAPLTKRDLTLVAEKVETRFDLDQAVELGCTLFQGYLLSRPALLSGSELPSSMGVCSQLLAGAGRPPRSRDGRAERTMKREVALVDGLLRLLNSAVFGCASRSARSATAWS